MVSSPIIPARDVKLIQHRWAMHAIRALSQHDAALLKRVFLEIRELPLKAIDTQVRTFGCGAPMQFHDYGFFDAQSQGYATPLFDEVLEGDTLLLIALRHHDPESVMALIQCEASLDVSNSRNERPIDILFDAFATLKLHKKRTEVVPGSQDTPSINGVLSQQSRYEAIFDLVTDRLQAHYDGIRDHVEAELYRIYSAHAPERVAKIDAQMQDFEYRETQLLASVKRKYEA